MCAIICVSSGMWHGVITLIVVVVVMLIAEEVVVRLFRRIT